MSTEDRRRIVPNESGGYRVENVVVMVETICDCATYDEAAEWIRSYNRLYARSR